MYHGWTNWRQMWFIVFAVAFGLVIDLVNGNYFCFDAESCQFSSISDSGAGDIICGGYKSCFQATVIESTNQSRIGCEGSYSCYESTLIQYTSSTKAEQIACLGLFSCAKVGSIINYNGDILCYGEQSCIETTITISSSNAFLYCSGDHSCINSEIYVESSDSYVYLFGSLSGQNSKFYSNSGGTTYWYFIGSESGYNASVICNNGEICYIFCYGDACNDLTYQEVGSGTVTVISGSAQLSDIAPSGYEIPSYVASGPNLKNITMSTIANSRNPCNNTITDSVNCLDSDECASSNLIDSESTMSPICCLGKNGCGDTINITSIIDNGDNFVENVSLRCDALDSCLPTDGEIGERIGNGDMYFTGAYSNAPYLLDGSYLTIIKTVNSKFDIFCTSVGSCRYQYIRNGKNLYCTSNDACSNSPLISNIVNNIVGYGGYSMQHSKIENVNNIYCGTYLSCYNTTISNVIGTVYGAGYQVFYQSRISNVENTVIGMGWQVLHSVEMENVSDVVCVGTETCANSKIVSIDGSIRASGDDTLSNSTIISNGYNDHSLHIYIDGTINDEFNVYCNDTDLCKIYCQSKYACTYMNIHCFGKCCVDCSASYNCPNFIIGSEGNCNTDPPTAIPTSIPLYMTTNMPTQSRVSISTTTAAAAGATNTQSTSVETTRSSMIPLTTMATTIAADTNNNDTTGSSSGNGGGNDNGIFDEFLLMIVIISIVGAVFVTFIICSCYCMFKRQKQRKHHKNNKILSHSTLNTQQIHASTTSDEFDANTNTRNDKETKIRVNSDVFTADDIGTSGSPMTSATELTAQSPTIATTTRSDSMYDSNNVTDNGSNQKDDKNKSHSKTLKKEKNVNINVNYHVNIAYNDNRIVHNNISHHHHAMPVPPLNSNLRQNEVPHRLTQQTADGSSSDEALYEMEGKEEKEKENKNGAQTTRITKRRNPTKKNGTYKGQPRSNPPNVRKARPPPPR